MPGFSDEEAHAKAVAAELNRLQQISTEPKAPRDERRRDALTRLFERGVFDADLKRAVQDSVDSGEPVALVMIDVDHFKSVNDQHGHQKGDAVLLGIASALEAVARSKGNAYRYGGEELALVLPNHTVDEGVAVAERLRRAIEAQPIEQIKVTVSLGVACVPLHVVDAAALVGAADKAMYDAKKKGRNLVRVFDEPEPPVPRVSRQVVRRLPEPGLVDDRQRAEFRHKAIRGEPVLCPNDGAPFEVSDATTVGSVCREYVFYCPDCGLRFRAGE